MAKAWFMFTGENHTDGPYSSDNYSLLKLQPDYVNGSVIGAIYADIEIIHGKVRPHISLELQLEITMVQLLCRPSTNVLLKPLN